MVPKGRRRLVRVKPPAPAKPSRRDDDEAAIPDKLYFKIGEVAELTGIQPYVLRYWETEFGTLHPAKSRSGQRLYRRNDVLAVLRIKELLYRQGFTIAGARRRLSAEEKTLPPTFLDSLGRVKNELRGISAMLRRPPA